MPSSTLVPVYQYIGRLYAFISSINHAHYTVEFAEFVTSRGLEKSDELGKVTNYANR